MNAPLIRLPAPGEQTLRFGIKPVVFGLSLLPALLLLGRGFGWVEPGLGANPVETIQDESGIWGLRFLLLTLAMTPLRNLIGASWPIRLRRMLGLFAFFYASLHFANYLVLDQTLYLPEIIEDIAKRPFITIGALAVLLLIPLAVTSTRGWQRRLGKRWWSLHKLIYPIAVLGCWHLYWQSKKDVTEALIYCAILALLLAPRLWSALKAR